MNNRFKPDSPEFNLDNYQKQCDSGGLQIEVARQALNEVLDKLADQDVIQKAMCVQLIKEAKIEVLDRVMDIINIESAGGTLNKFDMEDSINKLKSEKSQ